ncbi:Putative 60S ribosomal protein L27 [Rhizopus microsporus]|nr:Putative 60S ribosomal protein L27 [Rhizopus microsporus]
MSIESSNKSTRNIVNNTPPMPRLGNTTMNFPFNPSMPYFAAPPVPPNIRMYNEMMMRGNMRNNNNNNNNNNNRGRNGPSYNQQSTGNSMYLNPAFFEQQQQ